MKKYLIFPAAAAVMIAMFSFRPHPVSTFTPDDTPGKIVIDTRNGSNGATSTKLTFDNWQFTEFELDRGDLSSLKAEILIDTKSLNGDWDDLVKSIKKKENYFDVKHHPTAAIRIEGATPVDASSYTTEATMTLKNITHTLPITFTISEEPPYTIVGDATILRKHWDFTGDGPEWEIPVYFEVTAPEQ